MLRACCTAAQRAMARPMQPPHAAVPLAPATRLLDVQLRRLALLHKLGSRVAAADAECKNVGGEGQKCGW